MAVVYKHIRLDNNEVFYIGIGKSVKRAYSLYHRNKYWHNVVEAHGYEVEIIHDSVTWEEAEEIERQLIAEHGRVYIDEGGTLVNMTAGGDGGDTTSQHPNKKAILKKRSKKLKGKKRSEEQINKIVSGWKDWYNALSEEEKAEMVEKRKRSIVARKEKEGYTEAELKARELNTANLVAHNKTPERRRFQSEMMKKRQTGVKFTEEHKKNIGKSSKGRVIQSRRKAVVIEAIEYPSMTIASESLNMPINTVRNRILNDNFKDWNYKD